MKIGACISLLLLSLTLHAQVDLNKKISIQVENVSLDSVFEILLTTHKIHLAFGIDNIPSNSPITIQANNQTLQEIIQTICRQSGLSFTVIGNSIVLRYTKPPYGQQPPSSPPPLQLLPEKQSILDTLLTPAPTWSPVDTTHTITSDTTTQLPFTTLDSIHRNQDTTQVIPQPYANTSTLKKNNLKFNPRLTASGIFANYALDFNQFHFQERDIAFQKFAPEKNNSVGVGAYAVYNKKLYLSLGIGYATRNFVLSYNFQVLDPRDPMPIPDQTKVNLTYVELPLTIGYHIYSKKRFSLWLSTGFFQSFLIEKNETTTYLNKENQDTAYFLHTNQSTLCSLTLGFITHYYVYKRWGIFLEAGYLYCFDKVNTTAMESNTTTCRIKSGIQFALHPKIKPS